MQTRRTRFNAFALSAASLTLMLLALLAAQQPTQIHPPPPPVAKAFNIAVLADGFTAAQQGDFNEAAEIFFNHGLLVDSVFRDYKELFSVKTIFNPVTTTSESQFGFVLGTGITNCSISWTNSDDPAVDTAGRLETAALPANPTHIVVIANQPFNIGCANDNWVYIAVGALGERILQHEFGHALGRLYDEYSIPELANVSFTGVADERNCSTANPPHWTSMGLSNLANAEGCALFGKGIRRPYNDCLMGLHGEEFCDVCATTLKDRLGTTLNTHSRRPEGLLARAFPAVAMSSAGFLLQAPTAQQPKPATVVRLLLNVNRTTGAVSVLTANEVPGRVPPGDSRNGSVMYEIRDNTRTLSVGVLPGDPFRSHGYRGGMSQQTRVPGEQPAAKAEAKVTVSIPGESRDSLLRSGRQIEVWFYTLNAKVNEPNINEDVFARLRNSKQLTNFARLEAGRLREALSGKPSRPQAR